MKIVKIGIIGGSGLENPDILKEEKEISVSTPYGKPSSKIKLGKIGGIDVVLLSRHGPEHTITPTYVNFRANIHALKEQGCTHILATTACGSLRENIGRGDLVILDQFIDHTRHRPVTFYEEFEPHQAIHVSMPEPFSAELRDILIKTCKELKLRYHPKGTVITIEGPRFSTKAESHMFRAWGADVINMSVAPEAVLANEAGIPYAAVAMSTDYDSWKENEEPVKWEEVLKVFKGNVDKVTNLLVTAIPKIGASKRASIKEKIRTIPHWPKQGVMFRDITTLLKDPQGFAEVVDLLYERYKDMEIDKVVGVESRGFIIGAALAHRLNRGFIPIRKPGKLPAETIAQEYELEYGRDRIEIHTDAINRGDRVLLVDDLLATGGTMRAACELVKKLGGEIVECSFIVELPDLNGRKKLDGYPVFSLVEFEGD